MNEVRRQPSGTSSLLPPHGLQELSLGVSLGGRYLYHPSHPASPSITTFKGSPLLAPKFFCYLINRLAHLSSTSSSSFPNPSISKMERFLTFSLL